MRKFIINVEGKSYEVEVEEVSSSGAPITALAAKPVAAAPVEKAAPAAPAAPSPAVSAPAGATSVNAPMPGTILDIKVSVGDSVKRGEVLCILEAMKMENEIVAPSDGKIAAISVSQGASVNAGDVLIAIA